MEIHPLAAAGFTDGEVYERGRPGYPAAAVDLLRDELGLGPGRRVVELGAGTGRLTRPLLATGASVVAVEPLAGMRALLPADAEVVDASAEALPLADASVDAAVAGDAWHWFDPESAAREVARVLRPGGGVAVLWHRPAEGAEGMLGPWARALREILEGVQRQDHPGARFRHGVPALDGRNGFGPLTAHRVPYEFATDADGLVAYVASTSWVAALEPGERERVLERVREAVPAGPMRLAQQIDLWVTRLAAPR